MGNLYGIGVYCIINIINIINIHTDFEREGEREGERETGHVNNVKNVKHGAVMRMKMLIEMLLTLSI